MRRVFLVVLVISLCLIPVGCGRKAEEEQTEEMQLRFQELAAASVEAELTSQYEEEVRTYTLRCNYRPEETTVEVLEPEEIAGITAVLTGEDLTLRYEDIMLDAGTYSGTEISPMWAVPSLLRAMGEGYPLESCREKLGEADCLRVTFETTDDGGNKRYYAVWFGGDGIPLQGEIIIGDTVVYTAVFTQFTIEETENGTTTAEDMGGD